MLKNTLILLFLFGFAMSSEAGQKEQLATLTNELARLCPTLKDSIKNRTQNFIKFTQNDCAISYGYLLGTPSYDAERTNCQNERLKVFNDKLKEEIGNSRIP